MKRSAVFIGAQDCRTLEKLIEWASNEVEQIAKCCSSPKGIISPRETSDEVGKVRRWIKKSRRALADRKE